MIFLWNDYSVKHPVITGILNLVLADLHTLVQFLLDCTAVPAVNDAVALYGPEVLRLLFYLTRSWCYSVHRARCTTLGLWSFR